MGRLVVVSNRVSVPGDGSTRAGGLEVALRPALQNNGGVWLGWSGKVAAGNELETRSVRCKNIEYVITDLSKEDFEEYYSGFANRVLWPILHYRLDLAEFARRDLSGYFRVNNHFAAELAKVIEEDDLIWVHDYHLIPIADALRRRGCNNRIGFFLHVPLPPPEILTSLPNHEQLIPLLMQYDVVGFQTEGDVQNFVRYLISEMRKTRMFESAGRHVTLKVNGQETLIGSFPVGIEPRAFARLARRNEHSPLVKDLIASLGGRHLVIGVDRLDYSKGLIQRLDAFDLFLANDSDWLGKLTYVQITPTNRAEIPEYSDLQGALESAAGRINGKYGEVSWTPIRYVNRVYSRSVLAGLYRTARVGLVTPLRDGMNLVAKEYVAAQDPDDPGVLVLSRFTGAAIELRSALLVNPYDAESVANALSQALAMPLEERRARHQALHAKVCECDINRWQREFLTVLRGAPGHENLQSYASNGELTNLATSGARLAPSQN
ncbi:MAG TPA: trehalose-6-phosphate synthase [Terriglobales bacterium]|nr:trehalose-6-phosphate synthase [Terriglobales bacterium]